MITDFSHLFTDSTETFVMGQSTGRLDIMGGIADYSGSMVLQKTVRQTIKVNIRKRFDGIYKVISRHFDGFSQEAEISEASLLNDGLFDHAFMRNQLRDQSWLTYVLGCFLIVKFEKGIDINGADVFIESNVPIGKGVASSAALEVAVMKAIQNLYDVPFEGTELSVLAQKVENKIVGAPCGLMDQLATFFGDKNSLLPIICQPDRLLPLIEIPKNLHFVGIDSGKKHAVSGSPYRDVRTAAFMGYSMIEQWLGATKAQLKTPENLKFRGYLANISKYDFDVSFLYKLPQSITGERFMEQYGESIDSMTTIEPTKNYAVRQASLHPVYENERVQRFVEILQKPVTKMLAAELGDMMYAAHASYTACGLGSEVTDTLVQMAKNNQKNGVLGAKITGGGNGGTVCLLCEGDEGLEAAQRIHQDYQKLIDGSVAFFE